MGRSLVGRSIFGGCSRGFSFRLLVVVLFLWLGFLLCGSWRSCFLFVVVCLLFVGRCCMCWFCFFGSSLVGLIGILVV